MQRIYITQKSFFRYSLVILIIFFLISTPIIQFQNKTTPSESKPGPEKKEEKVESESSDEPDEEEMMTEAEKENYNREMAIKRNGRWLMGFFFGIQPDAANLSTSGPNLKELNSSFSRFEKSLNSNENSSRNIKQSAEILESSDSVVSFPIGFKIAYQTDAFLFRLAFYYHYATTANNSLRYSSSTPEAFGETPPYDTGGKTLKLTSKVSLAYLEIPFTIALRIINFKGSNIYIGGGPTFFYGGWKRETRKNNVHTASFTGDEPDIDIFTASTIGLHFSTGAEIFLSESISLNCELVFSFGSASNVDDGVTTSTVNTVKIDSTDENEMQENFLNVGSKGAESKDNKESSQIQFRGTQLLLGINFYL